MPVRARTVSLESVVLQSIMEPYRVASCIRQPAPSRNQRGLLSWGNRVLGDARSYKRSYRSTSDFSSSAEKPCVSRFPWPPRSRWLSGWFSSTEYHRTDAGNMVSYGPKPPQPFQSSAPEPYGDVSPEGHQVPRAEPSRVSLQLQRKSGRVSESRARSGVLRIRRSLQARQSGIFARRVYAGGQCDTLS